MTEILSVSVKQAIQMTGISCSTIYRLFEKGTLTKIKVGGKTLIRISELKSLVSHTPDEQMLEIKPDKNDIVNV